MNTKVIDRGGFNANFHLWVYGFVMVGLTGCRLLGIDPMPYSGNGTFVSSSNVMKQGIMISEVTSESAIAWVRTEGSMPIVIKLLSANQGLSDQPVQAIERQTRVEHDYIETIQFTGLESNSLYEVQVSAKLPKNLLVIRARFKTANALHALSPVKWVWGGDIGGQGYCRKPDHGYDIFDHMKILKPDFAILLGDVIYGDGTCPSPPNIPGSDFVATTLEQYRAKHRYQREDQALQSFLSAIPIYAQWDDHEVRNDFSGSTDALSPIGLEAFHDYWPTSADRTRLPQLHRQIHRGGNLDLFFLDTRQYRSPNTDLDGPQKTMLGKAQLTWLLAQLVQSQATWKFIVSSVPLSLPVGEGANPPAVDSWAHGKNGTGFGNERNEIVQTILFHQVSNVVWITTDVHFAQVLAYDQEYEGKPVFHEFVSGPLSAIRLQPMMPEVSLNPTVLYSGGGFFNFGEVMVDQSVLELRIIDDKGATKFQLSLPAQQ